MAGVNMMTLCKEIAGNTEYVLATRCILPSLGSHSHGLTVVHPKAIVLFGSICFVAGEVGRVARDK